MRWRSLVLAVGLALGAGCPLTLTVERCDGVTCDPGSSCVPATGRCAPDALDAGLACAADASCPQGAPRCRLPEGVCVQCLQDDDCAAGTCDAALGRCQPLPDSCVTAGAPLEPSAGPVTVRGDTTRAKDDVQPACALPGAPGRDLVYTVRLQARKRLTLTAKALEGSGLAPVLLGRIACSSTSEADSLGCAAPALGTQTATLVLDPAGPGDVAVWVDGEGGSEGAFELTASVEDTGAGESCAAPIYLPLVRPLARVVGTTSALADDAAGTCGGSGARDVVYALQTSSPKRVTVEVSTSTPGFTPAVYLRSACDDASAAKQLGCQVATASGPARLDVPRLEAGTWFLFVDGAQPGTAGDYLLSVFASDPAAPPQNEDCASAEIVAVPAGGTGSVTLQGDTSLARSDALGCGGDGRDVAYRFTTAAPAQLEVRAVPKSGSALRPSVYLRGGATCASEALVDQLACAQSAQAGLPAVLVVPHLPAGTWALWVDGVQGSFGPFELRLDFKPPAPIPQNDTCSLPASLSPMGSPLTVTGTTWGATDQNTGCEEPLGSWSPDVVYTLVMNSQQSMGIELKAEPGSALKPVLTVKKDGLCSGNLATDRLGCLWGDPQFPDRLVATVPALDPGLYPLWVEGDDGTQGGFTLRLTPGPPLTTVPSNDDCATTPPSLTQGVAVTGDTRAAWNDSGGACGLPAGANGELAPDVVYKLSLPSTQAVTLTVTPDAQEGQLFRPLVYLRGTGTSGCALASTSVKGCQVAQAYGGAATLSIPSLAAGTYWVWVDGAGFSSGKFTLRWQ